MQEKWVIDLNKSLLYEVSVITWGLFALVDLLLVFIKSLWNVEPLVSISVVHFFYLSLFPILSKERKERQHGTIHMKILPLLGFLFCYVLFLSEKVGFCERSKWYIYITEKNWIKTFLLQSDRNLRKKFASAKMF